MSAIPVIDLFSGPGGLAEGFAGVLDSRMEPLFRVALSVEMEESAHRTLLLRAFLRKFRRSNLPAEYYDFLNEGAKREPNWKSLYPNRWLAASNETLRLTLGTPRATAGVRERVRRIRKKFGGDTVLLGGPPCQSYSLVGRARNAGNANYNPRKDERQSLYLDYVTVLRELQPAVAIMENVKGMLSARHLGQRIFYGVMSSLQNAGGTNRYRLFAVAPQNGDGLWGDDHDPKDFLVRAEEYGVPQARHRVIVICVRRDIADQLPTSDLLKLERRSAVVPLAQVIGGMPTLRSRLSRGDSEAAWKEAVGSAFNRIVRTPRPDIGRAQVRLFEESLASAWRATRRPAPPYRNALGGTVMLCPSELRDWIFDEKLSRLPNNETRGHMPEDLARYLFAASFALATGRSPKARDFPKELAPNHANWTTGKFCDRFRVQLSDHPSKTVTSHISKDGHYFIHPDPSQCRSLTVREAARLQTFPDSYFFCGGRTQQYVQVGNAVPPYLALQIARRVAVVIGEYDRIRARTFSGPEDRRSVGCLERTAAVAVEVGVT